MTEPREERVIAAIDTGDPRAFFFRVQDTAAVEEPFEVTIVTTGGGCDRLGDTDVSVEDSRIVLIPHDTRVSGGDCTHNLVYFYHKVTLQLATVGEALVVLRARDLGDRDLEVIDTVSVQ